jgi:signal peptidase
MELIDKQNLIIDLRVMGRTIGKKKAVSTRRRIIKSIIEWTVYALLFAVIVWGTPRALAVVLHSDYPIAAITSGSMWPDLKQGDIVFIKGISDKSEVALGEIVVYENEKGFTIHRVVKLNDETLVTKGDANNMEDQPIAYGQLIGEAVEWRDKVIRIPYLGRLSIMFKQKS